MDDMMVVAGLAQMLCQPILSSAMDRGEYVSDKEAAIVATSAVRIAKAIVIAQRELQ